jgi:predicted RNA methylase
MVEAGWRPTVGNYLGRVTKPRILEAVREGKGEPGRQLIDHLKKGDMAKEAERLLADSGWLPHLERGQRIDAATCARDGNGLRRSDAPAPGTGRRPMTPARRDRPVPAQIRKGAFPQSRVSGCTPCFADAGEDRGASADAHPPFRGKPGAPAILDADPARPRRSDRRRDHARRPVLEPSAGTGLLAILAEIAGGSLDPQRTGRHPRRSASLLFPAIAVTRFDAAQIDDHLDAGCRAESVVLMNPPFSVMANVSGRVADAAYRHVASALARLAPGGRLVDDHRRQLRARQSGLARRLHPLAGARPRRVLRRHRRRGLCQARHDDRHAADRHRQAARRRSGRVSGLAGIAPDVATLLGWIAPCSAARSPSSVLRSRRSRHRPRTVRGYLAAPPSAPAVRWPNPRASNSPMRPSTGRRPKAPASPMRSMKNTAAVDPYSRLSGRIRPSWCNRRPWPRSRRPSPPTAPTARCHLRDGLLSDAQLETVIYAGEAHGDHLAGSWTVDETFDSSRPRPTMPLNAVRFRRGFFLGDGTGAGKGRQSAGIMLDNWLQGRRKAVWISKSDKLIEDAQRDWSALGMERLLVTPLSRFPQGAPITLPEGILFTTYATLRSDERGEKVSRVDQIVDWLGSDFDGVIIFDEATPCRMPPAARASAAMSPPRSRARAGLRLQHALPECPRGLCLGHRRDHRPQSRLCAAARPLGRRGFSVRDARRVRRGDRGRRRRGDGGAGPRPAALGLYTARSLSYDGVEYELVEHALTPEQRRIYDAYAGAFAIIHNNLDAAMEAANITGAAGTLNRQAKSAARSAFESAKQRFFGHLLTSMKTPTLIRPSSRSGRAMPPSSRSSRPARR